MKAWQVFQHSWVKKNCECEHRRVLFWWLCICLCVFVWVACVYIYWGTCKEEIQTGWNFDSYSIDFSPSLLVLTEIISAQLCALKANLWDWYSSRYTFVNNKVKSFFTQLLVPRLISILLVTIGCDLTCSPMLSSLRVRLQQQQAIRSPTLVMEGDI